MKSVIKYLVTAWCFFVFLSVNCISSTFLIKDEYDVPRVFNEVAHHFRILSEEIPPLVNHALKKKSLNAEQRKELFIAIKKKDPILVLEAKKSPQEFLDNLEYTISYTKNNKNSAIYYIEEYTTTESPEDSYNLFLKELYCIKFAASTLLVQ